MGPEDYTAVKSAVDSYSDVDRPKIHPLRWLDEIPAMAEEWRASEAAARIGKAVQS
jgi:hypothetical protein